jgi:hypothetical protein
LRKGWFPSGKQPTGTTSYLPQQPASTKHPNINLYSNFQGRVPWHHRRLRHTITNLLLLKKQQPPQNEVSETEPQLQQCRHEIPILKKMVLQKSRAAKVVIRVALVNFLPPRSFVHGKSKFPVTICRHH